MTMSSTNATKTMVSQNHQPLTPATLAKLKNSKKINVLVGYPGETVIAVEGAASALLCHRMGFAAKQLANKDANCLLVVGGNQYMVRWICQWISAGETDVGCVTKFYSLSILDLCDLYRQAEYLEYAALADHIRDTVSSRLQKALPSRLAIHKIYQALPDLGKVAVHEIVLLIIKPKEFNYQPFMDLAIEHKGFAKDLGEGVEAMLAKLIKRGEEYYADRRAKAGRKKNARSSVQCSKCNHYGHVANKCRTKPQNRKRAQVEVTDNGGGLMTCIREVKRGERTRTGLLI